MREFASYKILPEINFEELPRRPRWVKGGIWTTPLDNLPMGRVLPVECLTRKDAERTRTNILGTLRAKRRDYRLHTALIPDNGKFTIYIWKE